MENERNLRGGSWGCPPRYCQLAKRHWNYPDTRDDYIGFRVVCVPIRVVCTKEDSHRSFKRAKMKR